MSGGAAKRVLVTRSAGQASGLAERLRELALEPVLVPAIETAAPSSFAVLDRAVRQLDEFDWLLFTSATAVHALADRLGGSGLAFGGKVAAIGPATAAALPRLKLAPDLVPQQAVAESLTEALLPFARQADGRPNRFLLVRAEEAREQLPAQLRQAGAEITVAPAYRTVIPQGSQALVQRLLGRGEPAGRIDAITFTSSSTARNLLALCAAAGVEVPGDAKRVSIGPITSETLRELGLPPHAEAREATVAVLAKAVFDVLVPM